MNINKIYKLLSYNKNYPAHLQNQARAVQIQVLTSHFCAMSTGNNVSLIHDAVH